MRSPFLSAAHLAGGNRRRSAVSLPGFRKLPKRLGPDISHRGSGGGNERRDSTPFVSWRGTALSDWPALTVRAVGAGSL